MLPILEYKASSVSIETGEELKQLLKGNTSLVFKKMVLPNTKGVEIYCDVSSKAVFHIYVTIAFEFIYGIFYPRIHSNLVSFGH